MQRAQLVADIIVGLRQFLPGAQSHVKTNMPAKAVARYYGNSQRMLAIDTATAPFADQRAAVRAVFIAMPAPVCEALPVPLLALQDQLLADELAAAAVVDAAALPQLAPGMAVWQGDMSVLKCDAVVNPGNSALLGCFLPSHKCLDNILHAQAGPRLRIACAGMLAKMGITHDTNGNCRTTDAFAMPSRFVFHTIGPDLNDENTARGQPPRAPTEADRRDLSSCYASCLDEAARCGAASVAFCCISTGIFGYPSDEAALIAVSTVQEWRARRAAEAPEASQPLVVFNVFKDEDLEIYQQVLPTAAAAAAN
jgi:O-acetyl-ADP-ribose deacetylase (regulator of RNase III)